METMRVGAREVMPLPLPSAQQSHSLSFAPLAHEQVHLFTHLTCADARNRATMHLHESSECDWQEHLGELRVLPISTCAGALAYTILVVFNAASLRVCFDGLQGRKENTIVLNVEVHMRGYLRG